VSFGGGRGPTCFPPERYRKKFLEQYHFLEALAVAAQGIRTFIGGTNGRPFVVQERTWNSRMRSRSIELDLWTTTGGKVSIRKVCYKNSLLLTTPNELTPSIRGHTNIWSSVSVRNRCDCSFNGDGCTSAIAPGGGWLLATAISGNGRNGAACASSGTSSGVLH